MDKGNIVKSLKHDREGMILALTKDGKRAKVKVFGYDEPVWRALDSMTVIEAGWETCWKCGGSGIFQGGGGVLNGKFTGYTGECFACSGKGKQDNADRLRNHYYWHRADVIEAGVAEAERGEFESLERTAAKMGRVLPGVKYDAEPPARKPKIRSKKISAQAPVGKDGKVVITNGRKRVFATGKVVGKCDDGSNSVDCTVCGFIHSDDTLCL